MRGTASVGLLLTMTLLVGCAEEKEPDPGPEPNGIAEMSVERALAAADKAMSKLSDATYRGSGPVPGERVHGRVAMVFVRGGNCQVTFNSAKLGTLMFRVLEQAAFFQVDEKAARKVLEAPPSAVDRFEDRWIRVPMAGDRPRECELAELVPGDPWRGRFTAQGTRTVDGEEARVFKGRDQEGPLTLWIATTGEPLVLRFTGLDDEQGAWNLTSSDFDSGIDLRRPDPEDIVNLG